MEIKKVTDPAFARYGRVLTEYDFAELVKTMEEKAPCPADVVYEPSVDYLEALTIAKEFQTKAYGEMDVQVGYCDGNNYLLNAVEYHRSSELNIAATDAVLILGRQQDIAEDYSYDTAKMEAFLLPKGCGVEIYATTLHYAPCNADENGFKVVVVLPKGTNYPLAENHAIVESPAVTEDCLLAATNKWLIGHPEADLAPGSFIGLKGVNLSVK
ncbi:MAG: DUF4867 family protein [Lachnospiraceae bacterium]